MSLSGIGKPKDLASTLCLRYHGRKGRDPLLTERFRPFDVCCFFVDADLKNTNVHYSDVLRQLQPLLPWSMVPYVCSSLRGLHMAVGGLQVNQEQAQQIATGLQQCLPTEIASTIDTGVYKNDLRMVGCKKGIINECKRRS